MPQPPSEHSGCPICESLFGIKSHEELDNILATLKDKSVESGEYQVAGEPHGKYPIRHRDVYEITKKSSGKLNGKDEVKKHHIAEEEFE